MTGLALWLWVNCAGNLVASALAGVIVWFWKIRPHVRAVCAHIDRHEQHTAASAEHRDLVEGWFAQIHDRLDRFDADQPAAHETGQHALTETMQAMRVSGTL